MPSLTLLPCPSLESRCLRRRVCPFASAQATAARPDLPVALLVCLDGALANGRQLRNLRVARSSGASQTPGISARTCGEALKGGRLRWKPMIVSSGSCMISRAVRSGMRVSDLPVVVCTPSCSLSEEAQPEV